MVFAFTCTDNVGGEYKSFSAAVALSTKASLRSYSVLAIAFLTSRKDYLIKRAYVEFICPSGETQIGINHRFNEQDEDEFRLQDVLHSNMPYE